MLKKSHNFTSKELFYIENTHLIAMKMLDIALSKLCIYDKKNIKVQEVLDKHFHINNKYFVKIVIIPILIFLKNRAKFATYKQSKVQIGNRLGFCYWFLPFTKIKLYPLWFSQNNEKLSAKTIIHEWFHRYLALLDLGYSWEYNYHNYGTIRSILNADSWASFIYDLNIE